MFKKTADLVPGGTPNWIKYYCADSTSFIFEILTNKALQTHLRIRNCIYLF